jgi:hypothetical protein
MGAPHFKKKLNNKKSDSLMVTRNTSTKLLNARAFLLSRVFGPGSQVGCDE